MNKVLIVDVTRISFIDSTGLKTLVAARDRVRERLLLAGPNPVLYAITTDSENTSLVIIQDTGPASTGTAVASPGANQTFRGLRFGPSETAFVPRPKLGFTREGTDLILNWSGAFVLQSATNVTGSASITVTVNDGGTNNNIFSRTFGVAIGRPLNAPAILSIIRVPSRIDVLFTTEAGFRYTLESKSDLSATGWNTLSSAFGTGTSVTLSDTAPVDPHDEIQSLQPTMNPAYSPNA